MTEPTATDENAAPATDAPVAAHAPGGGHTHAMTAVLEDVGPCKKVLKVEVAKDEVAKELEERLEDLRRSLTIKGFRKGKVPRKLVEKNYKSAVEEEVRKHLLEHSYGDALKAKGVDAGMILGETKLDKLEFSAEKGLTYEVTFQVRPTFELPAYSAIPVSVAKPKVRDEDLEKELELFRRTRGEVRPVADPKAVVEPGDTLACEVEVWLADEYESFVGGQEAKSGKGGEKALAPPAEKDEDDAEGPLKPLKTITDVEIKLADRNAPEDEPELVAGLEVDDLTDGLVGLAIGEWGEAETQLPVDYEVQEGRNEQAVLRVRVDAVKRVFLPDLTDEWAKSAGHDSVEALRREARDQMFRQQELRRDDEIESKAIEHLLRGAGNFDLPEDLIAAELEDAKRRRALELRQREKKSEDEAKRDVESEQAELAGNVVSALRTFFLVDEICRREKIRVTDSDIDARIARIAASSGRPPSEVKKFLADRGVIPQIRHELQGEKARAFLREHAQVTETED